MHQIAPKLARRGIVGDAALCEAILQETGVALLPGTAFGLDAAALAARLAYVDFDGVAALDAARSGAEVNDAFLQAHAAHLLEGITRLCDWTHAL